MTREELEAVRNHISNLPTVGAMYAPVLVEWVSVLLRQRDEARAVQEESEHQMHLRIRSGYDKTIADSWRAKVAEVEAERDAAVAKATAHERDWYEAKSEFGTAAARAELAFLRKEYGEAESSTLTRDALELKAQVLEASLLHVCKAASEITSWDFSHLLLEHPDAKTLLGDVAALEAALKQHGPERS